MTGTEAASTGARSCGRARGWLLAVSPALTLALACYGEPLETPRDESRLRLEAPPRAGFEAVADALQVTCGTLDCHGQPGRNLRLYGARGLRIDPGDSSAEGTTTAAEYEATYWSVVGLEPEPLSAVVRQKGSDSTRLTLVRKARGDEQHKGGRLMAVGDDLDRCLTSWLAGQVATAICETVSLAPRPPLP
jgi:hypothetical protein